MNLTANKLCAWSGVVFVGMLLVGLWGIADFIPPHSPHKDAGQIAAIFSADPNRIRIGLIVMMFGAVLIVPWAASISIQMRRMEGPQAVLAICQIALAALLVLTFEFPGFFWLTATFRADRSAESVQLLNDLAWLPFVGLVAMTVLQAAVIGIAILGDAAPAPVFPRWAGYLNLWCALLFMPGAFNVFFKSGPLAWNGLIAFYLPVLVFCIWFVANTFLVLKAIGQQERVISESLAGPAPRSGTLTIEAVAADLAALRQDLLSRRT
jgi:hypothetical protein